MQMQMQMQLQLGKSRARAAPSKFAAFSSCSHASVFYLLLSCMGAERGVKAGQSGPSIRFFFLFCRKLKSEYDRHVGSLF